MMRAALNLPAATAPIPERGGVAVCGLCDRRADDARVRACTAPDCPLRERRAA